MRRRVTQKRLEAAAEIARKKGLRVTVARDGAIVFDPVEVEVEAGASEEAQKLESAMAEQMATGRGRG